MSDRPRPGRYYRIRKGDTLLGVAGRAYGVGAGKARLALARRINRHPLNRKYLRPDKANKLFPEGLISFLPGFDCVPDRQIRALLEAPKGRCFAVIWIPVEEDLRHSVLGKAVDVPSSLLENFRPASVRARRGARHAELETAKLVTPRLALVPDATRGAFRFVCSILPVFPNLTNPKVSHLLGPASGTLIGFRHVLTAAHVLHDDPFGDGSLILEPAGLVVTPGHDSPFKHSGPPGGLPTVDLLGAFARSSAPLGSFTTSTYRVPDEWKSRSPHSHLYDYGLIRLSTSVGRLPWQGGQFGYWGSSKLGQGTILAPQKSRAALEGKPVFLSGYPTPPVPRHGIAQWLGRGPVDNAALPAGRTGVHRGRRRLGYRIPTEDGHSGSPVWRDFRSGGRTIRRLVAVHSGGGFGVGAANGVLFNRQVAEHVLRMKRST